MRYFSRTHVTVTIEVEFAEGLADFIRAQSHGVGLLHGVWSHGRAVCAGDVRGRGGGAISNRETCARDVRVCARAHFIDAGRGLKTHTHVWRALNAPTERDEF